MSFGGLKTSFEGMINEKWGNLNEFLGNYKRVLGDFKTRKRGSLCSLIFKRPFLFLKPLQLLVLRVDSLKGGVLKILFFNN